jgi:hypothetical protein
VFILYGLGPADRLVAAQQGAAGESAKKRI